MWTPRPRRARGPRAQEELNLHVAMSVLRRDDDLVDWLSDRLVAIADTVPEAIEGFRLGERPRRCSPTRGCSTSSTTREDVEAPG